jgi:hypothetical protein
MQFAVRVPKFLEFDSIVIPSRARDLTVEALNTLLTLCDQAAFVRSFTSFRMILDFEA